MTPNEYLSKDDLQRLFTVILKTTGQQVVLKTANFPGGLFSSPKLHVLENVRTLLKVKCWRIHLLYIYLFVEEVDF